MPEFVQVLLKHKAHATITDSQGLAPIHVAAQAGHEDVVRILLRYGVDINIRANYSRQTPTHIAALQAREEVVKLLVKSGERHYLKFSEYVLGMEIEISSPLAYLETVFILLFEPRGIEVQKPINVEQNMSCRLEARGGGGYLT